MRHSKRTKRLGRTASERKALMRSLVVDVLKKQRITTTLAKAKETRRWVDKVITLGKKGDLASQRMAFAILRDRSLVKELVTEIAPRFSRRNGGYTRILRRPNGRKGDNASLVFLELTEQKPLEPAKKSRRKKEQEVAGVETVEKYPEQVPKGQIGPPAPSEKPKPVTKPKEIKKKHIEKPKRSFFQGLKRFLRRKTG